MINLIAAVGVNGELGRDNRLCWRISADLKRFKALTIGQIVIMGRKTYESIGHPLAERLNIVISRRTTAIPGCVVVQSLEEALARAEAYNRRLAVFVIGGAHVYSQVLTKVDRIYLTHINAADHDADAHLDLDYIAVNFRTVDYTDVSVDPVTKIEYHYMTLDRKPG